MTVDCDFVINALRSVFGKQCIVLTIINMYVKGFLLNGVNFRHQTFRD